MAIVVHGRRRIAGELKLTGQHTHAHTPLRGYGLSTAPIEGFSLKT